MSIYFLNNINFVLNTSKYRVDLEKCLTKLNPIFNLYIILLTKNNICLFDLQMQILRSFSPCTAEFILISCFGTPLPGWLGHCLLNIKILHFELKRPILFFTYKTA